MISSIQTLTLHVSEEDVVVNKQEGSSNKRKRGSRRCCKAKIAFKFCVDFGIIYPEGKMNWFIITVIYINYVHVLLSLVGPGKRFSVLG